MTSKFIVFTALAAATVSSADPDIRLLGTYSVPLAEDESTELAPYASFTLDPYVISTNTSGQRTMNYTLPIDLAGGIPIAVTMDLVSSHDLHKSFSGPLGTAECDGKWTELKCEVNFHNLVISPDAHRPHLESRYGAGPETEARIRVAERFGGDPIGKVSTRPLPTPAPAR